MKGIPQTGVGFTIVSAFLIVFLVEFRTLLGMFGVEVGLYVYYGFGGLLLCGYFVLFLYSNFDSNDLRGN